MGKLKKKNLFSGVIGPDDHKIGDFKVKFVGEYESTVNAKRH
jgi:hypothetical protein